MFQKFGRIFLIDVGMSRGVDTSGGPPLKIHKGPRDLDNHGDDDGCRRGSTPSCGRGKGNTLAPGSVTALSSATRFRANVGPEDRRKLHGLPRALRERWRTRTAEQSMIAKRARA